jgi:hypothetical protein
LYGAIKQQAKHFTSPAKKPSISLVVDVCATGLAGATTYMKGAFEFDTFAGTKSPALDELLTPPLTSRFGFLNKKDPEQVRRETLELFQSKLAKIDREAALGGA